MSYHLAVLKPQLLLILSFGLDEICAMSKKKEAGTREGAGAGKEAGA